MTDISREDMIFDRFLADLSEGKTDRTRSRYAVVIATLRFFLDQVDVAPHLGNHPAALLEIERDFGRRGAFFRVFGAAELLCCLPAFLERPWLPRETAMARTQISVIGRFIRWLEQLVGLSATSDNLHDMSDLTAATFAERLRALHDPAELDKIQRYFKTGPGEYGEGDIFMGVRMGHVFALAKEFIDLEPVEIEKLLDDPIHEMRAGACSIMAKQATRNKTSDHRRQELYDLYLRRHDRINNWDLVDLAARQVIGARLAGKPRGILHELARSDNLWERRTAITAASVIHDRDLDDFYAIAEILLHDPEDIINKAVGGWIRNAGKIDRPRLLAFLEQHASSMPRVTLRFAIEHLDEEQRAHFRGLR